MKHNKLHNIKRCARLRIFHKLKFFTLFFNLLHISIKYRGRRLHTAGSEIVSVRYMVAFASP